VSIYITSTVVLDPMRIVYSQYITILISTVNCNIAYYKCTIWYIKWKHYFITLFNKGKTGSYLEI